MPIVGIVRNIRFEDFKDILPGYEAAGLKVIEVTLNTLEALEMITYTREYHPNLVVGAGTICTMDDLHAALGAGAAFIVTPITDPEVIEACRAASVPVFPGAFTASEIFQAWKAGASMVKVFPTTSVGPSYIRDIKGPLNQVPLMPTGGVDLRTIREFFNAGASAVGIGSKLFDSTLIATRNWGELQKHFKAFTDIITSLS